MKTSAKSDDDNDDARARRRARVHAPPLAVQTDHRRIHSKRTIDERHTFQTDHLLLLPNGPECIIDFKTAAEIVPDVAPIPNDMVTLVMMIDDDDGGG